MMWGSRICDGENLIKQLSPYHRIVLYVMENTRARARAVIGLTGGIQSHAVTGGTGRVQTRAVTGGLS